MIESHEADHLAASTEPNRSYLEGLNDRQRDAVLATDGPVLVLAGAGTGKTRVLTTRFVHLLLEGKARPWEVLAVTFTNKAAAEMRERAARLFGRAVEGWWIGTFHALSARILRAHAEAIGLKPNFSILDQDDQLRLLKQLLESHEIDEKRWPPRALQAAISRWKDRGLTPDKVSAVEGAKIADGQALRLYTDYQERLATLNACDFGDLLLHVITLFQKQPDVLARYQQQFRYILVDEYQDTNVSQYLWLRLLAQAHRNLCCVGDDDQSIYSWRGAEIGNILRFEADFLGATVIRLERNYRSTPHILAAASELIAHNQGRLGKTLWTESAEGEPVRVVGLWDGEDEARFIGDEIESRQTKGEPLSGIAILVRAGFQTREFEERLITLGVPYRVVGGPRFYERQEIRDAVAYLRVIVQPADDLAFERIANVPKRGLGDTTFRTVHEFARAEKIPLTMAVARLVETDELKPQPRATFIRLLGDMARWRSQLATIAHADLAAQVLDESGYTAMWRQAKTPEAPGRLENLKELIAALAEFENLQGFLEHVSLVMENQEAAGTDKVSLMTLHGAKGLEFDTVFLPGWEEGLFPNQRTLEEEGPKGLEEERRLAYVGLTRAKRRAIISFVGSRRVYNQWQNPLPSRFIAELPAANVEALVEPGLLAEAGGRSRFDDAPVLAAPRPRHALRLVGPESPSFAPVNSGSVFATGQRIFHQKFGYGRILAIDGPKLEIAFEKAGTKKVMTSFVEAT
ncbi:MAG: DNA helicase II [Rhodospirillales bacterium]|nr:DNA helicase II [Rhodospirillales bacterium]